MQVPQNLWNNFKLALYQFTLPVVSLGSDGRQIRMEHSPSILHRTDPSILSRLDKVQVDSDSGSSSLPRLGLPGTRCRNVGVVPRPSLPGSLPPPQPQLPPQQKKKGKARQKPSSGRAKRTLASERETGSKSGVKRARASEEETGSEGSEEVKKRKTVEKTVYFRNLKNHSRLFFLIPDNDIELLL